MQKVFCLFGIIFIVQFFTSVQGQHLRVQTWYDAPSSQIKEDFYVLKKNPSVKDSLYISYYQNGNMQSRGTYVKNKVSGEWEFYYENGNLKMQGKMVDNTPSGEWIYYYENGGKNSEGRIEKGRKEGEWVFYYENGRIKSVGDYLKGIREGLWKYFYEDGTYKAKAEFKNDKGAYIEVYPSGNIKSEGNIEGGKSNGYWKYYYEDGNLKAEGEEKYGLKEGYWKYYHPNGVVASEGNYLHGRENGKWKYYHENKVLSAEGENKEGEKEGYWKLYYKDGTFKAEGNFKQGDGEYKEYYESGKLKIQGNVMKGKNEGDWKYYYESGAVEGKCFFHQGKGYYKGFYENGTIKMEGMIEDGNKVGIWKLYNEDGQLAGYYKTYYQGQVPYFEPIEDVKKDSLKRSDSLRPSEKPEVILPKKKLRVYTAKVNEYKDFILSFQPLSLLKNQFGTSVEYYFQERLGFELGYIMYRKPFLSSTSVSVNDEYIRGNSIYIRQKFYQKDQDNGMFYWAQEVRFSLINHYVDYSDNIKQQLLKASEKQVALSIIVGDRLLRDARKKGWTLDIFGGLGVGYREVSRNYERSIRLDSLFTKLKDGQIFVPVRFGFSVGYLF